MPLRRRELPTGLVLNLSGKDQSLTAQDHDLLARASVVRIDPSNSCNAACVFCDSSFSARGARLPLQVFEEAFVRAGLNKLHVSLHAHEPDAFAQVMGKPELARVAANLRAFKAAIRMSRSRPSAW